MTDFKTPGVYVNEVTTFPPSVAQVETAIPVFIGYTQTGPMNELTKISSLLDYETAFGKAYEEVIKLQNNADGSFTLEKPDVKFLMYYSLQMFFANGGGECYIVSVGYYRNGSTVNDIKVGNGTTEGLLKGLQLLHREDEATMIVFPDATKLADQEQFYAIYNAALQQSNLQNRFVLLDTYRGNTTEKDGSLDTVQNFRQKINASKQGAAYFPHLTTILNYSFDEKAATIVHKGLQGAVSSATYYADEIAAIESLKTLAVAEIAKEDANDPTFDPLLLANYLSQAIAIVEEIDAVADNKTHLDDVLADANDVLAAIENYEIDGFGSSFSNEFTTLITAIEAGINTSEDILGDFNGATLESLKTANSEAYATIKKEIAALRVVLPPSSAVAGVYAKTDSTVGVWKAPANTGLNYVVAPTEKISNDEQDGLNVHESGKSINAIRTFAGKGSLVWGARTLEGNSNEWRYVPVRRLFNMVELSLEKATQKFIFDSNDSATWLRAKGMVENYLYQLWTAGALAGSKPEQAYYVVVGGETMNSQDILEGRMIVEIGLAAVRPAEFIVLKFSHKLQEA